MPPAFILIPQRKSFNTANARFALSSAFIIQSSEKSNLRNSKANKAPSDFC